MSKCRDDLNSLTRYVTWNLDERSSGALSRALPDSSSLVAVYNVAVKATKDDKEAPKEEKDTSAGALTESNRPLAQIAENNRAERDYQNLIQLMEEAFMSRDANRTNLVVGGLVHHIVASWQGQFCRTVTMKFNCYFMLPFVDQFHRFIRTELQRVYEGDGEGLNDVFDLSAARRSLQTHREELVAELNANKQLQDKFRMCSRLMRNPADSDIYEDSFSTDILSDAR